MENKNLNFDACQTMAKKFLSIKEHDNLYGFRAFNDNNGDEICCFNKLSDSDVASLRTLKGKYGETFVQHLDEVFDDPDVIHDFTCGCELLDIDLDYVVHEYGITIHELNPDRTVTSIPMKVVFNDDVYADLVAWHLYDEHLMMNVLRYYDTSLYNHVLAAADDHYFDMDGDCLLTNNPYLVTLDEAKSDAELIVKQYGIERTGAYRALWADVFPEE